MDIRHGLPPHLRAQAAQLYWLAFGSKLGAVLGPKPKAMAYLQRVLRPDHCIVAIDDGDLLGMVGLQSDWGSFAGGEAADLREVYGLLGGFWRFCLLYWVGGNADGLSQKTLLIDGFAVHPMARGQGVGTSLLEAALEYGQSQHYAFAQLDVTDTNTRARAFYASRGFTTLKRRSIWPFGRVFGFGRVHTMTRSLGAPGGRARPDRWSFDH